MQRRNEAVTIHAPRATRISSVATTNGFVAERLVRATAALARRAPAVVLCALATHAAIYRSLWPAGGDHGYLIWYAPLVATLSGLSIVALPVVLALAVAGRRDSGPLRALTALVTRGARELEPVAGTLTLASQALVFLFVQESLERSLERHEVAVASFPPSTWAVLLTVIVIAAGAVAWLGRAVSAIVEDILRGAQVAHPRAMQVRLAKGAATVARRPHPLAVHGGLRAPPAGA